MIPSSNKTSSSQGSQSPERAKLSVENRRPVIKRKVEVVGESSSSGEKAPKILKTDNIPLGDAVHNVLTIASGIAHATVSEAEKDTYNRSIGELLKENNHFMNAILAFLPKLSTEQSQNKKRLFNLYHRTSYIPTKEFIASRPDAQAISTIQALEENRKKNNVEPKENEEEKSGLSEAQKIAMLVQIWDNDYLKGEMQKFGDLFQQFFPTNNKDYEEKQDAEENFPFAYGLIEEDFSKIADKKMLETLVKYANPDIKKIILQRERTVKDENGEDIDFIKYMIDKCPNDVEIENTMARYTRNDILEKIFADYHDVNTILNIGEKILFDEIDESGQVDSVDMALLRMLANRERLSVDDTEHNQHLGRLLDLGKRVYNDYYNEDLLVALGERKKNLGIEGGAFSTDATENQQRSDDLIASLVEIIKVQAHNR